MKKVQYIIVFLLLSCQPNIKDNQKNVSKIKDTTPFVVKEIEYTTMDIAKNTLSNTVSIVMQDANRQVLALGSGVIIGNGKIVTNMHVISGAKYGYVMKYNSNHKNYISGYTSLDKENDLVLLSVPDYH